MVGEREMCERGGGSERIKSKVLEGNINKEINMYTCQIMVNFNLGVSLFKAFYASFLKFFYD